MLPLLAAALLAPGAARAAFLQASKPMSAEATAVRLRRHVIIALADDDGRNMAASKAADRGNLSQCQWTWFAAQAFAARNDERPRQARDMQYPRWQRLQWANWRELQLSNEAKRRFAAAILASGILLVLALKLIATKAADSVLDKPADK